MLIIKVIVKLPLIKDFQLILGGYKVLKDVFILISLMVKRIYQFLLQVIVMLKIK
jgi:hypothetical protein